MDDLKLLSDEELDTTLNNVLNEKERRQRLANVPNQIRELATVFLDGGGNRTELENAIL
jgi:hypothetical protein